MSVDLRRKVERELPYLRRFAIALTGNLQSADRLVMACLKKAHSRLHLYNPDYRIRVWLYMILRDVFVAGQKEAVRGGGFVENATVPVDRLQSDVGDEVRMMAVDLARAIEALQPDQREVLILVALEEFSYEEAADVLGVAVGTVVSRLARARKRLERAMREDLTSEFTAIEILEPAK